MPSLDFLFNFNGLFNSNSKQISKENSIFSPHVANCHRLAKGKRKVEE